MAVRVILVMCCTVVFMGFVICLYAGEPCIANFALYRLAQRLAETPAGMLFLAGIGLIALEAKP